MAPITSSQVSAWAKAGMSTVKVVGCVAMVGVLSSCISMEMDVAEEPMDFHIISGTMLKFNMQEMAADLAGILAISMDSSKSLEEQRDAILPLLDEVEWIATDVGGDGLTNYSVINQYMGAFLYDVGVAREFAEKSPPNLVPAERLVKSCLSCHESI